jgi:hypothetical protein
MPFGVGMTAEEPFERFVHITYHWPGRFPSSGGATTTAGKKKDFILK